MTKCTDDLPKVNLHSFNQPSSQNAFFNNIKRLPSQNPKKLGAYISKNVLALLLLVGIPTGFTVLNHMQSTHARTSFAFQIGNLFKMSYSTESLRNNTQ